MLRRYVIATRMNEEVQYQQPSLFPIKHRFGPLRTARRFYTRWGAKYFAFEGFGEYVTKVSAPETIPARSFARDLRAGIRTRAAVAPVLHMQDYQWPTDEELVRAKAVHPATRAQLFDIEKVDEADEPTLSLVMGEEGDDDD